MTGCCSLHSIMYSLYMTHNGVEKTFFNKNKIGINKYVALNLHVRSFAILNYYKEDAYAKRHLQWRRYNHKFVTVVGAYMTRN